MRGETVIEVRNLVTRFGRTVIHDGLDLDVRRGEVLAVVGGSGSGKTVLVREITGLMRPAEGEIRLFGERLDELDERRREALRARTGMLFQDGALFSSLTVAQNIAVPLQTWYKLRPGLLDELAGLKLALVGLDPSAGQKLPAELSGGMRKRAGLARALALDPEVVFLDEPTAGLDPIAAGEFDELIRSLQQTLGITVVMITHDLDSLNRIADRVMVLVDKRARIGTLDQIRADPHPWVQAYFAGPRGRAAAASHGATEAAGPAQPAAAAGPRPTVPAPRHSPAATNPRSR
jgi:phospholipid/cholesterol/gamma-HCH transport system ATP-binding protein